MAIRSASDLFYTVLGWLPLLAIVAGVGYVLALGVLQFEIVTDGTEFLVSNAQTTNALPRLGSGPSEQEILDAISSGDLEQMTTVLDRYEREQAALASS